MESHFGAIDLPRARLGTTHAPLFTTASLQRVAALSVVPLGASAAWLAAESDHLEHPAATALYRTYLVVASLLIGLAWWRRRPASRFGPVLVVFGLIAWVYAWQSANWPLAFDLGVFVEGPLTLVTFYLFLSFPSGRLQSGWERVLIGAWLFVMFGFFVPWVLGSPVIEGGGPLSVCVPACPDNVLQVGSAPSVIATLGNWETYLTLTFTIATLVAYAWHVHTASRPRRRALVAVAVTSLLFLPVFFVFHFSRLILGLDASTLQTLSWAVVGARILLPLGFLVALLQADLFAGVARGRLLEELVRGPSPERWRDAVAASLDDPGLRIAYWDVEERQYRESDGSELRPRDDPRRSWVEVDRDGRPVAALDLDSALAEDPELVRAATSATALAVEHGNLEGALRHSQARVLAAGDAERRRIERDLHDSAQQRLVALRIHLALAGDALDGDGHDRLTKLGSEVDEAIDDLRSIARGLYPKALSDAGVGPALRSVVATSAIPVTLEDGWRARPREEVEVATYFSCLEALQNAAKHAGPDARACVRLAADNGKVAFTVEDDGRGFDPRVAGGGAGLDNIADRVGAAGGTLRIDSARGRGTRVSASFRA